MGLEGSEELSLSSCNVDTLESINNLKIVDQTLGAKPDDDRLLVNDDGGNGDIQVSCFSDIVDDDVTLHFQIIRLQKQIYAWIGCHSAKLGHLYAAAPTRPSNNTVSITSLIGGTSDNTGSGIARRLGKVVTMVSHFNIIIFLWNHQANATFVVVIKTGLPIVLACNIPKGNPMLEADAEKKLMQKLISLGYAKSKSQGSSSSS